MAQRFHKTARILIPVLVAGSCAALAIASLASSGSDQPPPARSSETATLEPVPYSLDDVPGLGRTPNAVDRDELISIWDTWRRAQVTSTCMATAGFEWHPEVNYIAAVVRDIADKFVVAAGEAESRPGANAAWNAAYLESSPIDEADRYYRSLVGESLADMRYTTRTGLIPEERQGGDTFMRGGCKGSAWAEVGSVWDLKDDLALYLEKLQSDARKTAEFDTHVADYAACLGAHGIYGVSDPGTAEKLYDTGDYDPAVLGEAISDCDWLWTSSTNAGLAALRQDFLDAHAEQFQRHIARYRDAVAQALAHDDFMSYLAGYAKPKD